MKTMSFEFVFCFIFALVLCQPMHAGEETKRCWIDEIAGPIGELRGKGAVMLRFGSDDVSIALDDPENEEDLEFLGRGNSK